MKKKKLTANQQAYQAEVRRIRNFLRSVEKRGFSLPEGTVINLEMPSRVTAGRLRDIKRLTPETLYYRLQYVDETTGEIIKGNVRRKQERQLAAKRARETKLVKKWRKKRGILDTVLVNPDALSEHVIRVFRADLTLLSPKAQYVIGQWLNGVIEDGGVSLAAKVIQLAKDRGIIIEPQESYSDKVISRYIAQMANLMRETDASEDLIREYERVMDEDEEWEEWD